MKKLFAAAVFAVSVLTFAQSTAVSAEPFAASAVQGSGCPYVCKQELKRCRKGKKACRQEYASCLRECPH